jgi:hypothetical protein
MSPVTPSIFLFSHADVMVLEYRFEFNITGFIGLQSMTLPLDP